MNTTQVTQVCGRRIEYYPKSQCFPSVFFHIIPVPKYWQGVFKDQKPANRIKCVALQKKITTNNYNNLVALITFWHITIGFFVK